MNKGKTTYRFLILGDPQIANQIIMEWLKENQFVLKHQSGEDFYYHFGAWNGNRGFQYSINDNEVIIYAWTIGLGNQFHMLDSDAVNNRAGESYKEALRVLFHRINNANAYADVSTTDYKIPDASPVPDMSQVHTIPHAENDYEEQPEYNYRKNLEDETTAKNEKYGEFAFKLSIANLLLTLVGFSLSSLLVIITLYCAIKGLKTEKRKKAIAAIVISFIPMLVFIVFGILSYFIDFGF